MAKGDYVIVKIDQRSLRLSVFQIKRSFQVMDTENSGRTQATGEMYREIIGTFFNYHLKVEPYDEYPEDYDTFYEIISGTDKFHIIEVPYGQTTLRYRAYVTSGSDTLRYIENAGMENQINRWEGLEVDFIAQSPQRT